MGSERASGVVECVWLEDWVCMMDKVGMEWKKDKSGLACAS